MAGRLERTYGKIYKYMLAFINPIKKRIVRVEAGIHKYINRRAVDILKNDGYKDAYYFFYDHMAELNAGVVWADQDFKSINHFFDPSRKRGLYGSSNAVKLASEYYENALRYWNAMDTEKAIFYLGAAVHIVQDMTIPQHASIRLLASHHQYEAFIRKTYLYSSRYAAYRGGYYNMGSIEDYIHCNARTAVKIYRKLKNIKDNNRKYYTIAKFTLPLAQKTTAGCLLNFYKEISRRHV
ncbi:zinc dependent phospholipase C family protein [Pseudoclostridium thermosuccinogenes]|uniref:zinc dependent phospholipase C family protein n=1 Tax=Clostridium thermosuccinogenes TaxID=84032 RepID=UPI002FDB105F